VYVKGSGDINVDIAEYTDETYLGHTATWVRLTDSFVRKEVTRTITTGNHFYCYVFTDGTAAITFYVDGVQVEYGLPQPRGIAK